MRAMKPVEFEDDPRVVPETLESITTAEAMLKQPFPNPISPEEVAKIEPHVRYTFHDSDDEEDETY